MERLVPGADLVERGHAQDIEDVREMLARGLVDRPRLRAYFQDIAPHLYRYPAVDPDTFRAAVEEATRSG